MTDFYLETERLIIRNWRETDRALFHLINSDDTVMKYFPFRRTREESDAMMNDIQKNIRENKMGYTALELKATSKCIGFCGLHFCRAEPVLSGEEIEIGWRLAPQFQGKGYVTEAALELLDYGFNELGIKEIISLAVQANTKSFAVMERIGMRRDASKDFDHPRVPDSHPHLKRHHYYSIKNPNR